MSPTHPPALAFDLDDGNRSVLRFDREGHLQQASTRAITLCGHSDPERFRREFAHALTPSDRAELRLRLTESLRGGATMLTLRVPLSGGEFLPCRLFLAPAFVDGLVQGVYGFLETGECPGRDGDGDLYQLAFRDALTGLVNRAMFLRRLQDAWRTREVRRSDGRGLAVLFIDLDGFKSVNDQYGHAAGDALLQEAAERLQRCVRDHDLVGRLGGDEFVILLPGVHHDDVSAVARRIVADLQRPFLVDEREVTVSASVGYALEHQAGSPEELIGQADRAMYLAKRSGKRAYRAFIADIHVLGERELRRAIEQKALALYQQPVLDRMSGELAGVETLIRWQHPERGLLLPTEFLPQDGPAAIMVSRWALEQVGQYLEQQVQAGRTPPFRCALHVPVAHLQDSRFGADLKRVLGRHHIPGEMLYLEVPAQAVAENPYGVQVVLAKVRELGVRLSVEALDQAPAALGYLALMQVDLVRMSREFLLGNPAGRAAYAFLQTLGVPVVCSLVEDPADADALDALGVRWWQGYAIAPPAPLAMPEPQNMMSE